MSIEGEPLLYTRSICPLNGRNWIRIDLCTMKKCAAPRYSKILTLPVILIVMGRQRWATPTYTTNLPRPLVYHLKS